MNLYKAQVTDNTDFLGRGRFLAYCKELGAEEFWVNYVSPYKGDWRGGFVAIPDVGSEILIAGLTTGTISQDWYYMGSIFGVRDSSISADEELIPKGYTGNVIPDKEAYKAKDYPQRLLFQDKAGNKLVLSNAFNSDYMSRKAEVQSSLGKTLSLDDGKSDAAMLLNEHGDGIKIGSGRSALRGARSIELECPGSQKMISKFGDIELTVVDGREIDIINNSGGDKRDSNDTDSKGHAGKYGNINISSEYNDINLTVYKDDGKVFIDALGEKGLIQLDSGGDITIWSKGKVNINAGGGMNFNSDKDMNLTSSGNINIASKTGEIRMSSQNAMNIQSKSQWVNIDGQQVHLAPKLPVTDADLAEVTKDTNNYDN